MSQSQKRTNYTPEFRADAVKLVLEHGYSSREVGERLGVASSNVSRWVRTYRFEQQERSESGTTRRELEEENRRLRKENKRLQMEREILKKAAAFFAKESN
jgi:transposase